jgi:tellurite resistance protein TehA-like permease
MFGVIYGITVVGSIIGKNKEFLLEQSGLFSIISFITLVLYIIVLCLPGTVNQIFCAVMVAVWTTILIISLRSVRKFNELKIKKEVEEYNQRIEEAFYGKK